MEIPYVYTPRKDTGLVNSKIAIWLFLASEVMLFGGFFSAYVFLRIGADYPWPERALPVIPGLVNTFVLIASSVTVVFAWASLKLRQWRRFQLFMGFTIACAGVFMVLKGIEYNVKFHHQALRMSDGAVVEGHLGKQLKEGVDPHGQIKPEDYVLDRKGDQVEENRIFVTAKGVTFNVLRFEKPWLKDILATAEEHHAKVVLAADLPARTQLSDDKDHPPVFVAADTALTLDLLEKIKAQHLKARSANQRAQRFASRDAWVAAGKAHPGEADWEYSDKVTVDAAALKDSALTEILNVTFKIEPPVRLEFEPSDIKFAGTKGDLRDGTSIEADGNPETLHKDAEESGVTFHYVDALDFRYLALKAKDKGQDPMIAVEHSWVLANSPELKEAWEWHKEQIKLLEERLIKDYGFEKDPKTGKDTTTPKREPTFTERYRIEWKDFAAKAAGQPRTEREHMPSFAEEIKGPDYEARDAKTFPHLNVPREEVAFTAKFSPAWSTYYAIYFTMTGLHGLHVIGGALVLAYYLFFGRKMYDSNPEWLANRVEVGGLFWHFVDLVWIFLFPLLYLM